ncbi:TadE/TadG family type IV pilus assembly protein [Diplocloster agilis]|uniref:TadE/TadG family type IV pilus assembly protein n=1 Tax=Diplocloster agilis TaxID=2850323 RepID=UPI0022658366|nr:hypothetical protein [Suonthocola fibrivorans]MCU6732160.1 hypothetical protein [Suonthocola fibrivorans]
MTVEAAVILPFVLFVLLSMMYFTEALRIQRQIQDAAVQTSLHMSQYAYKGDLTQIYAYGKIKDYLSKSEQDFSMIKGGAAGISCFLSDTLDDADRVDLVVSYTLKLPYNVIGLPGIPVVQRACTRGWTGYEPDAYGKEEEQIVYVTEHGTVYHKTSECSHIDLTVRSADYQNLSSLRNAEGQKFSACEKCGGKPILAGRIFITNTGDCYHTTSECSGLKRGVLAIPISQAADYRPCSRCGG